MPTIDEWRRCNDGSIRSDDRIPSPAQPSAAEVVAAERRQALTDALWADMRSDNPSQLPTGYAAAFRELYLVTEAALTEARAQAAAAEAERDALLVEVGDIADLGAWGPFTPATWGNNDGRVRDGAGSVIADCFGNEAVAQKIGAALNLAEALTGGPSDGE